VSIASKFLTDKAYDFYLLNASLLPQRWLWHEFAEALFNHCFPTDFRTRQRSKLNNFKQREHTVKEYTSHLYELFIVVGLDAENPSDKRIMADKFWHGLRAEIQEQLWLSNLNPDVNLLDDIRMSAERIEMAQSVASTRNTGRNDSNNYSDSFRKGKRDRQKNQRNNEENNSQRSNNYYGNRSHNNHRYAKNKFKRKTNRTPNMNNNYTRRNQRSKSPTFRRRENNHRKNENRTSWVPQDEWDHRRREGKCSRCGSGDHMTRQCPDAQMVPSSSKNPPGIRSNTVEISNIEETERLRTLAETTECSNEIELSVLMYNTIFEDSEETDADTLVYATCIELSDIELKTRHRETQQDVTKKELLSWICSMFDREDDLPELLSISNSSLEEDEIIDYDHKNEIIPPMKKFKGWNRAMSTSKNGPMYPIMDNDRITLPPNSPIFEFLHNKEQTADTWERVNEWVREQFRTNSPKEDTGHNLNQRLFRLIDNGFHANGRYYSGNRITNFLDNKNGIIGNIATTKLEQVLMDFSQSAGVTHESVTLVKNTYV
jgi:hypothetical protein